MNTSQFLRTMVLSLVPVACVFSMTSTQAFGQSQSGFAAAHFQPAVFDGSSRAGWYSFPGQSPKLNFDGDRVRITSRRHSTVLLSRTTQNGGGVAEVSLDRAPISTSSISGLAVMSDAQHAMVIGLEGGNVVLWQLDPNATRVVARRRVNSTSPLEFRVAGGNQSQLQFSWRHKGDAAWHPLGSTSADSVLASWREPLRYGLLLDGPQGSEVTFSNFRSFGSDVAAAPTASIMTASLASGR